MEPLLMITAGGLFAAGFYLLMRRSIVKLIMGLVLVGHAGNLLIFASGNLMRGTAPFVAEGITSAAQVSDPLPQALILTAIVIGFGVQAFAIVLIRRVWQVVGTDDLDALRTTDNLDD